MPVLQKNKDLCKKCYAERELAWGDNEENQWAKGIIECPVKFNNGKFKVFSRDRTDEVASEACPVRTEHMKLINNVSGRISKEICIKCHNANHLRPVFNSVFRKWNKPDDDNWDVGFVVCPSVTQNTGSFDYTRIMNRAPSWCLYRLEQIMKEK